MKVIYILGSGGLAKEIFILIKQIGGFEVGGFIDIDDKDNIEIGKDKIKVISETRFLEESKPGSVELAIGIGDPKLIKKLSSKFGDFYFPNLIHPSVVIEEDSVELGTGNIITAGVVFTTCISVGSFNIFNLSSTVGHDVVIGNWNVINPAVNISGGVHIENMNLLGVASTILQYKNIGNNNIIGAASLLTKDVLNDSLLIGVPARIINKIK